MSSASASATAPRRVKATVVKTPRIPKAPKAAEVPAAPKPKPKSVSPLKPDALLRLVFDQELLALGLPPATPEYMFALDIGRRWRIDKAWPHLMVALEIEGGVHIRGRHLRPAGFLSDMDKYNELALRGWLLIRISYEMIKDGRARDLVVRALATRAPSAPSAPSAPKEASHELRARQLRADRRSPDTTRRRAATLHPR